jgi:lysozyme
MEWMEKLTEDLRRHEGLRLRPYKDSVGKLTIGYGRNLDDRGIHEKEAEYMLSNDIAISVLDVRFAFPWFDHMTPNRKRALANMAFNLGMTRLLGFKRMLKAMAEEKWAEAATEALASKWATQVGKRAEEIAELIRDG